MGRLTNNPLLFPSWGIGKTLVGSPPVYYPLPTHAPTAKHRILSLDIPPGGGESRSLLTCPKAKQKRFKKKIRLKNAKTDFFSKGKKNLFVSTNMFVDLAKTKGKKRKKNPSPILPTLFRVPGSEHSYSETVFRPRASVAPGSPAECVWRALACAPSFMFTSCKYIFILHSRDPM